MVHSCVKNTNITDIRCIKRCSIQSKKCHEQHSISPWCSSDMIISCELINGFASITLARIFTFLMLIIFFPWFLSHGASIKFCLTTFNYRHRLEWQKHHLSWELDNFTIRISQLKHTHTDRSVWFHGTTIAAASVTVLKLNNRAHL